MSLNNREGGSVCLTEEKSGTEVILAAKFLTKRVLNVFFFWFRGILLTKTKAQAEK